MNRVFNSDQEYLQEVKVVKQEEETFVDLELSLLRMQGPARIVRLRITDLPCDVRQIAYKIQDIQEDMDGLRRAIDDLRYESITWLSANRYHRYGTKKIHDRDTEFLWDLRTSQTDSRLLEVDVESYQGKAGYPRVKSIDPDDYSIDGAWTLYRIIDLSKIFNRLSAQIRTLTVGFGLWLSDYEKQTKEKSNDEQGD